MPTLTQLEYIIAVYKFRHFGRAAANCHVSQPSLSAQIQKVEEELGFVIFDRSKKPIHTTDKGELFIHQAKLVLNEHRKLLSIADQTGALLGEFKLGVIPTLSCYIIPLFLESFSKNYPGIELKISENKTEEIIQGLIEGQLDAGLLATPLNENKVVERPLFLEPFFAFASKNNELYGQKSIRGDDLDPNSIWLLNEGHCLRDQVIRVCHLGKKSQVLKNIEFESGSLETLKNLIRKGQGYTLLPYLATMSLSKEEQQKNLIPFAKPIPTREISLVHSQSFFKTEILLALEKEILDHLPSGLDHPKKGSYKIIDL